VLASAGPAPNAVYETPFRIGETEARTAQLFGWAEHIVAPHNGELRCAPAVYITTAVSVPQNGVIRDVHYSLAVLHGGSHMDEYGVAMAAFSIFRPGLPEKRGYVHSEMGRHLLIEGNQKKRAAVLSGHECVPQSGSFNFGCLVLIADDVNNTVSLGIMTDELDPQTILAAHIHTGAPGQNGPIATGLGSAVQWTPSSTGSATIAVFEKPFPPEFMPMLLSGNCYVDVHTTQYPDGELRGQIIDAPEQQPTGVEPGQGEGRDGGASPRGEIYNAPNPFLGSTTIHFALAEPSPVTVRVFDASGRVVRALIDGQSMPTGAQSAAWDGTTATGEPAAAGTYFYRIESGTRAEEGRMVLIR
jgi:hypothetical protein